MGSAMQFRLKANLKDKGCFFPLMCLFDKLLNTKTASYIYVMQNTFQCLDNHVKNMLYHYKHSLFYITCYFAIKIEVNI